MTGYFSLGGLAESLLGGNRMYAPQQYPVPIDSVQFGHSPNMAALDVRIYTQMGYGYMVQNMAGWEVHTNQQAANQLQAGTNMGQNQALAQTAVGVYQGQLSYQQLAEWQYQGTQSMSMGLLEFIGGAFQGFGRVYGPLTEIDTAHEEALVFDVAWRKKDHDWVHAKAENLLRDNLDKTQLSDFIKNKYFWVQGSRGNWFQIRVDQNSTTARVYRATDTNRSAGRLQFYCAQVWDQDAGWRPGRMHDGFLHPYDDAVAKLLLLQVSERAFLAAAHGDTPGSRAKVERLTQFEALNYLQEPLPWPKSPPQAARATPQKPPPKRLRDRLGRFLRRRGRGG